MRVIMTMAGVQHPPLTGAGLGLTWWGHAACDVNTLYYPHGSHFCRGWPFVLSNLWNALVLSQSFTMFDFYGPLYHRQLPRHSWWSLTRPCPGGAADGCGSRNCCTLFAVYIFPVNRRHTAGCCLAQHKNIINLSDPLAGQLPGENKPGKYTFILMCTEIKHVTCRVGGKCSYKSSSW